jgi:toxin ParE1/3/4
VKVEWSTDAANDLRNIAEYIAQHNPRAAAALDTALSDAAADLVHFPLRGRAGRIVGTRELLAHPHYRLVYSIVGETIWIEAIVHTSRQWPAAEDPET